jgi:hypothetical protein
MTPGSDSAAKISSAIFLISAGESTADVRGAAGLGDESPEVDHHVFPHEILGVAGIGRPAGEVGTGFFHQARIQVAPSVAESDKPRKMVDAGAFPFHLGIRNPRTACEQVTGSLHRVAETGHAEAGGQRGGGAQHSHGIGVIEDDRQGTQTLDIAQNIQPHGNRPQSLEQTARPDRVADERFEGEIYEYWTLCQTVLIPTCADLSSPEVLAREVRALVEAQATHPDATALLLSLDAAPPAPLPPGVRWQSAIAWLLGDELE